MVRRDRDPGRGLWSVPGGRVEQGETLADAVAREVLEETGITTVVGELLGVFEVISPDDHLVVLDYLATADQAAIPIAADDAAEARWVPLDQVAALECTERFVETLRGWGVLE